MKTKTKLEIIGCPTRWITKKELSNYIDDLKYDPCMRLEYQTNDKSWGGEIHCREDGNFDIYVGKYRKYRLDYCDIYTKDEIIEKLFDYNWTIFS